MDERRLWKAPQLIEIVRGTPVEHVLAPCKTTSEAIGAESQAGGCAYLPTTPAALQACSECDLIASS